MARRSTARLLLAGTLLAAALQSGCADQSFIAPGHQLTGATVAQIGCRVNIAARAVNCAGPEGAPGQEILGGQGIRVALRASNVAYDGGTEKFTFDATVQNLGAQPIGTDGGTPKGVRVFFASNPVPTPGPETITIDNDSIGTFTGVGQAYYVYPESLATNQISFPVAWQFGVPNTVSTFAFTVLVAADVPDAGGLLRFSLVRDLSLHTWSDIAANTSTDAMAVGGSGSARFDGFNWNDLVTPAGNFNAVAPLGAGKYVAVNSAGDIYIFDGKIWTRTDSAETFAPLHDVWVGSSGYFVAVGNGGAVSYDHGTYTDEPVAGSPNLFTVTGVDSTDTGKLYAASAAPGQVYVRQGGVWTAGDQLSAAASLLAFRQYDSATFVWAVDSGSYGIVGYDSAGVMTQVAAMFDTIVTGIYTRVADTVYLATETDITSPHPHTTLLGASFSSPATHPFALSIAPVAGTSSGVDIAPGGGLWLPIASHDTTNAGGIGYWNGSGFGMEDAASAAKFLGIWGEQNQLWVASGYVGGGPVVWGIANGVVNPEPLSPSPIRRIWGVSDTEVYVLDSIGFIWRRTPTAGWFSASAPTPPNLVNSFWVDSTTHRTLIVGNGGEIFTGLAGSWSTVTSPTSVDLYDVWGCSGTEAWIVGQGGHVLHYSSGSIVADTILGGGNFYAVRGSGCSDVWVVGDSSHVYHWDGSSWTAFPVAGGDSFQALYVRAPGEVYVGGFGRVILVTTSGGRVRMPTGTGQILGLWGTADGKLYGVGRDFVFVGER